jgi:hypothetical protein
VLVARDDATVRHDDFCSAQVVARETVLAAKNPDAAAERKTGDPDRRTAARSAPSRCRRRPRTAVSPSHRRMKWSRLGEVSAYF